MDCKLVGMDRLFVFLSFFSRSALKVKKFCPKAVPLCHREIQVYHSKGFPTLREYCESTGRL
jgi:hypothetical protein